MYISILDLSPAASLLGESTAPGHQALSTAYILCKRALLPILHPKPQDDQVNLRVIFKVHMVSTLCKMLHRGKSQIIF